MINLQWPLKTLFITSPFCPPSRPLHFGIDLRAPEGEPVYAAADGVVLRSEYRPPAPESAKLKSYGNKVVIAHPGGYQTWYAHLSARCVEVGEAVKAGQKIGLAGNTGNSQGPHLHFELRRDGAQMDPTPHLHAPASPLV